MDLLDVVDHAQRMEYSLFARWQFFEPVNWRQTFLLTDLSERRRQSGRRVRAILHAGPATFVLGLAEFPDGGDSESRKLLLRRRRIGIAILFVVLEHHSQAIPTRLRAVAQTATFQHLRLASRRKNTPSGAAWRAMFCAACMSNHRA